MIIRSVVWALFWLFLIGSIFMESHTAGAGGEVTKIAAPYRFDLLRWEMENLPNKWVHALQNGFSAQPPALEDRLALVREYFALGSLIHQEEDALRRGEAGSTQRLEEANHRRQVIKPDVEAIIEDQISQALAEEGLSLITDKADRLNMVFPPVDFGFSDQPNLLVVSPREHIETEVTILLRPAISIQEIQAMEENINDEGKSALVVKLGGFAAYPSLVPQNASLEFTLSTVAHEWLHHYLTFLPLGQRYGASGPMTTINETVADIGGKEIGCRVLKEYGQNCPPEPDDDDDTREPDPLAFDFNAEMRQIRLRVDEMLSNGEFEKAEAFMRERRDFLDGKGYYIRKLNQAFFAFHGRYADAPASVDPTGTKLRELRRQSPSLGQFINRASSFTKSEDLDAALKDAPAH